MSDDVKLATELIALLTAQAPALRRAGVQSLSLGNLSVTLAPALDEPIETLLVPSLDDADDDPRSIMSDPATYGRKSGVPGYTRDTEDRR
jgi:hypothetical protein